MKKRIAMIGLITVALYLVGCRKETNIESEKILLEEMRAEDIAIEVLNKLYRTDQKRYQKYVTELDHVCNPVRCDIDFSAHDKNGLYLNEFQKLCMENCIDIFEHDMSPVFVDYLVSIAQDDVKITNIQLVDNVVEDDDIENSENENNKSFYYIITMSTRGHEFKVQGQIKLCKYVDKQWKVFFTELSDKEALSQYITRENVYAVLSVPEYPLNEQAVLETAKQCDFPEEWTITENEMRQTEGLIASSYSLKAVNTEVYAGMKIAVTSYLQGENRVVRVNATSLDNTEELSKEEVKQSLEFITRLFGGFSNESVIADVFIPVFQIDEAFTWERDIEGATCTIDYNPQKDAGKLLIAISDNKELLYPQWPDLGIELSAKNVTSTGLTLVVDFEGGEDEWEMGMSPFQLEMLEDGKWKAVPFLENVGYVDNRLKPVPRNTSTEFEESWEKVYGSLGAGKYRMNRFFTEIRKNLEEDQRLAAAPYSVEFEIK